PARGGPVEDGGPDQPGDRPAAGLRRADRGAQAAFDPRPLVGGGGTMSPTTPPGGDALTPELIALLEPACDRFEAAWHTGERPALEDYLAAMPAEGGLVLFRELLALELAYRHRVGERPELEEYRARYPAWVAAVDAAFATSFDQAGPAPHL